MNTIQLAGCTPIPLSGYLKALGVLRIVAEQKDPTITGWWEHDRFHIRSALQSRDVADFFLNDYSPTPLVAPWNGGSGFYPKDNHAAIDQIFSGESSRFANYRNLIEICRTILSQMGLAEKPDSNDKPLLLQQCRNQFPDDELQWLDAAFVLTDAGPKYPPLLGTGGNDGRLEFTNNYMQRLTELFDTATGQPTDGCRSVLDDALFSTIGETRQKAAIGQFDPGSAGGPNSSGGYDADPTMNVWDFILMLEGAIAFAGSSVRKLEHAAVGSLAYPFCVRTAGVGYGSADFSDEDTARSEMWMPMWERPATFSAVTHLLSEGRVDIGRRRARNGVDFARAIASVGVDRGIDAFQRFGFQQRNGLSYFAVPLGRFNVQSPSSVSTLLGQLDTWLVQFRREATGQHAPRHAAAALRSLENGIVEASQRPTQQSAQQLLIALGIAEAAIANSPKLRSADYPMQPVPLLSKDWLKVAYDPACSTATEFRLAAALASMGTERGSQVGPLRRHLEPINFERLSGKNRRSTWAEHADDPSMVWSGGSLVRNLIAVLKRRLVDVSRSGCDQVAPFAGQCSARLNDVTQFVNGSVDDVLLESLMRGLMLIDWSKVEAKDIRWPRSPEHPVPSAAYCLLKLCLLPEAIFTSDGSDIEVKLSPQIAHRAAIGDLFGATKLAAQRLRASGLRPAVSEVYDNGISAERTTAALVFPLSHSETNTGTRSAVTMMCDRVLRRETATAFDNTSSSIEAS